MALCCRVIWLFETLDRSRKKAEEISKETFY
jgi:hypothetical protein